MTEFIDFSTPQPFKKTKLISLVQITDAFCSTNIDIFIVWALNNVDTMNFSCDNCVRLQSVRVLFGICKTNFKRFSHA